MGILLKERQKQPVATGDDNVDQMLVLAERLRVQNGGVLDEAAIQAVAEATGASLEYVRLAVKIREEREHRGFVANVRAQFYTLEPETRRFVASGVLAAMAAALSIVERKVDGLTGGSANGFFGMLALLAILAGCYNAASARESRTAAIAGAVLTGGMFILRSLFAMLFMVNLRVDSVVLIPVTLAGALGGMALHQTFAKNRKKLGLKDPVQDRQELLAKLHELREQLEVEQTLTFLSVDVVGSTKLKQGADPLAVEFTFNEYHQFVERVAQKYGGRVHSTAGDGVICAFENAQEAFGAARNLQASLIELNTHRNKLGVPLAVRCGIHSGTVVAPDAEDVTSLNFAEVIDIAAHLQKEAPAGGIAVSEAAGLGLIGGMEAVGKARIESQGVRGAIWMPKSLASGGAAAQ